MSTKLLSDEEIAAIYIEWRSSAPNGLARAIEAAVLAKIAPASVSDAATGISAKTATAIEQITDAIERVPHGERIDRALRHIVEIVRAAPTQSTQQPVNGNAGYVNLKDGYVNETAQQPDAGEPVAWRSRYRSEPGMIGHYPWSYMERIRGQRLDSHYEYEPLYAAPVPPPQVAHSDAAESPAPIETIEYWAKAYESHQGGGHGMIVRLLEEYAALRRHNCADADPNPSPQVAQQAGYVQPLSNPRLQELFSSAITGAMGFGFQGTNQPPPAHWLTQFWDIGRNEALALEAATSRPPQVAQGDEQIQSAVWYPEAFVTDLREERDQLLAALSRETSAKHKRLSPEAASVIQTEKVRYGDLAQNSVYYTGFRDGIAHIAIALNTTATGAQGDDTHADWAVGLFSASSNTSQKVLHLSVGSGIERDQKHASFIQWVYWHPTESAQGDASLGEPNAKAMASHGVYTASMHAFCNKLAVTEEWMVGWNACLNAIDSARNGEKS